MIWIDAQISPHLALWIKEEFQLECYSLSYLKLSNANDREVYENAKLKNAIIISKDSDFVELILKYGSPPKLIWLTCGNTSNLNLKNIFKGKLLNVLQLLNNDDIVEISD